MPTLTPDTEFVLSCVAEFRAVGCRWSVIAWRMEMPIEELRALVRERRDEFHRRVRWIVRDRRLEEEAKEHAALRKRLHEALTETQQRVAAEKLSRFVMARMRADTARLKRKLERRATRRTGFQPVPANDRLEACPTGGAAADYVSD